MFGFTVISKERLHRLEEFAMNSNECDAVAYTKAYNTAICGTDHRRERRV